jgi:hypothetical protein
MTMLGNESYAALATDSYRELLRIITVRKPGSVSVHCIAGSI